MATEQYWASFWDGKAGEATDFQATGRGRMDVVGFLYTVRECARLLDLGRADRLLDVGCGTGIFALALSPFVKSITAFDISTAATARAKSNLSDVDNVTVEVGSISSIPADGLFDKVLGYSVLQYLSDQDAVRSALNEIARKLKPDGRALLAANPNPRRFKDYLSAVCGSDKAREEQEVAFQRNLLWIDERQMLQLAAEAGLQAEILPIHPRIWQSFYMYDLVVGLR